MNLAKNWLCVMKAERFLLAKLAAETGMFNPWRINRFVGKKAAGRLLDGREWNEVPAS